MKDIIVTKPSKKQNNDAGLALTLILLILGFFLDNTLYFKIALVTTFVNMTLPALFYPFTVFWFSFSGLLGTVVSKILLTVVFYFVVMPIGLIRKIMGKDSLKLAEFKKSNDSAFVARDYQYSNKDLEQPY